MVQKSIKIKVAVTGASGHVGNVLCRELVRAGYQVRACIHREDLGKPLEGVERVVGDVCDLDSMIRFCKDSDVVFHLAAKISINGDPDGSVMKTNVEGTRNVVNACVANKVKRLVYFSSIHSYQKHPIHEKLDEEREYVQEDGFVYDFSKALGEQIVLEAVKGGLDAIILNPTAILGPFDYGPSLMGQVFLKFCQGKFPAVIKGGFDWVDVRDVVNSAIRSLEKGRAGERYLLSGQWRTIKEMMEISASILKKKHPLVTIPTWLIKVSAFFVEWYSHLTNRQPFYTRESIENLVKSNRYVMSCKAKRELGHSSRPFEETIRDTLKWFQQESRFK